MRFNLYGDIGFWIIMFLSFSMIIWNFITYYFLLIELGIFGKIKRVFIKCCKKQSIDDISNLNSDSLNTSKNNLN